MGYNGEATARQRAAAALCIITFGLVLGLVLPRKSHGTCASVSALFGWVYFAAWTVSFYPQVVQNAKRRSVVGMSFDFVALNVIGFFCYSCYNISLYWSVQVRREYADHNGDDSAVELQDVAFAVHALALSLVTLCQIALYDRGPQRFALATQVAAAVFLLAAAVGGALVLAHVLAALTLLNLLSYVKLAVTLSKFCPQVLLNIRRRSTAGWNIDNILLDLTGGSLSLTNLLLDAGCTGAWSKVAGDPVKFGLGFVSICFDAIFIFQHYVLYPAPHTQQLASPLLKARPKPAPVTADEP